MKRFLIIAFVVMLVVAMLAVPAFADSVYTAYFEHGALVLLEMPSPGTYRLSFSIDYGDDGVTDTVVIDNVKLMQAQTDNDGFMVAEFILSEPGVGDIPLCLSIFHESAGFDSLFPNWDPVTVKIQDDGGNMLPLAALSLERVTEPVSGEEAAMDSVGSFFSGVLGWLQSLGKLFEQPLFLLFAVCVPLVGFGIWGLSKLKNS